MRAKLAEEFQRNIQGMPFGERIMPMYIFADPQLQSQTIVTYSEEQRGDSFWFKRRVQIFHPGQRSEDHYQCFGPYASALEESQQLYNLMNMDRMVTQP